MRGLVSCDRSGCDTTFPDSDLRQVRVSVGPAGLGIGSPVMGTAHFLDLRKPGKDYCSYGCAAIALSAEALLERKVAAEGPIDKEAVRHYFEPGAEPTVKVTVKVERPE